MQSSHMEAIRRLQQKAEEVSRLQKEQAALADQSSHASLASLESDDDDVSLGASISNPLDSKSRRQVPQQGKDPPDLVRKESCYVMYLWYFILIQILLMGTCFSIATFRTVERAELYDMEVASSFHFDDTSILVESCSSNNNTTDQTMVFSMSQNNNNNSNNNTYQSEMKAIAQDVKDQGNFLIIPDNDNTFQTDTCKFRLWVIPNQALDDPNYLDEMTAATAEMGDSNKNIGMTVLVSVCFAVLLVSFLIYHWLIEKRQAKIINIATKASAIVEGLFPAQVRDRMLNEPNNKEKQKRDQSGSMGHPGQGGGGGGGSVGGGPPSVEMPMKPINRKNSLGRNTNFGMSNTRTMSVKQYLDKPNSRDDITASQPIADLFQNTSVIFADIAGFTAWSSQREPSQVFTLLETLYGSFDEIAKTLNVFKVETIGDSYMAVTGLPIPDSSHAVNMARFAYACLRRMKELTGELEAILGPGTTDLHIRVGIHSGAVTAGVLRGEKSRFQLFGDTVNTASRMESTGRRGKIQVSQETADLLKAAGKPHWLKPRDEVVIAKGKGELKTYWMDPSKKRQLGRSNPSKTPQSPKPRGSDVPSSPGLFNSFYLAKTGKLSSPVEPRAFDEKYTRLIDWNVDVLLHHLARVISSRSKTTTKGAALVNHSSEVALLPSAIDDVAEIITLPPFDLENSKFRRVRPDVSTLQQTRADLHEYVTRIAGMYNDVPFHNFEHASHVTLCANKLLNRLINSDEYESEEALHNATFGISSDPLTHFAIVFSALIHDTDHVGLPNAQLVKDKTELAIKYKNKSVAEQNSTHLGWQLLMEPRFERLRKCIYQTNVERKRFRQLVINSIMATDIADKKNNESRQQKWDRAFRKETNGNLTAGQIQDAMNHKATVVIEHIMQVSDVAHTMQHWHIYRRWNERLFYEMHDAFKDGRVDVDPSLKWYLGEIGFFDYYLIPLAMKVKDCGVFGASGYEYVSYVLKNKKEWERKGQQVVQEMVMLHNDLDESGSSDDSSGTDTDDPDYDSPGDLSSSDEELDFIVSIAQQKK